MPESSHPFINGGSFKSPLAHPVALGSLAVSLICRYYAVAVVVAMLSRLLLTFVDVLVLGAEENRLEASTLTAHESSRETSRHIQLETSRESATPAHDVEVDHRLQPGFGGESTWGMGHEGAPRRGVVVVVGSIFRGTTGTSRPNDLIAR
jgi:hypothetical protein